MRDRTVQAIHEASVGFASLLAVLRHGDADNAQHAEVFMVEDVALADSPAADVGDRHADSDGLTCGHVDGVW